MTYILLFLFAWWALSIALVVSNDALINKIKSEVPMLPVFPVWAQSAALIVALSLDRRTMAQPFYSAINLYLNYRLKKIARRIKKAASHRNDEVGEMLRSLAEDVERISKT